MALEPTKNAVIQRLRAMMEAHPYDGSAAGYYGVDDAVEELYQEVGFDKVFVGQLLANNDLILDEEEVDFPYRHGDGPNYRLIRGLFMLLVNAIIGSSVWLNEEEDDRRVAWERALARAAS